MLSDLCVCVCVYVRHAHKIIFLTGLMRYTLLFLCYKKLMLLISLKRLNIFLKNVWYFQKSSSHEVKH